MNASAFRAAMTHPERLVEIWAYEPSASPSIPGAWQTYQPAVAGFASDLGTLVPGKGYWVNVSQSTSVTIAGPRWDASLSLQPGWNLVGFPGLDLASNESRDLTSVFGSQLGRIQQVWTFDKSLGRFSGYDVTAIPALKELSVVRPASGYWIYALDTVAVSPQPYVALPGDADGSPLEPEVAFSAVEFSSLPNASLYVGTMIRKVRAASEDVVFDLNGNGIIDGPFTQDTLQFEVGVDRQTITVGNNGIGASNWVLTNAIPWLFTASADAATWPVGSASRPKTASGVVAADRDTLTLHVDPTGLAPGTHTGSISLFLGTQLRVITVKLKVPTSAGDWKGFATTQRVNGKNIGIGAVDMALNLFMDSESLSETGFRAVLNQDKSLLFPRDVFLNGVFYSGDNFSLTTNFQMDPGDRNAPPFDTFAHAAPGTSSATLNSATARADRDFNGNNKLDVENPFPFSIHRQVTLLGRRVSPNRMEGSYIEALEGMLPNNQSIFIEGTFFLDRQTLAPTKKSIFNDTTKNSAITIGGTSGVLFRETSLTVSSPVAIQGVSVTLDVSFPDASKLIIYLIGPGGQRAYLSRNASTLGTVYTVTDFNGLSGAGTWKLHVEWAATSLRGSFNKWSLNVQGLATYTAAGKVVTNPGSGQAPLSGVHAILSGSNVLKQADSEPFLFSTGTITGSTTATLASTASLYAGMPITGNAAIPANASIVSVDSPTSIKLSLPATATTSASTTYGTPGQFAFSGLTENNYTITLTKPGYVSRSIPFYLNNASYYIVEAGGAGGASTDPATLSTDPVIMAAETAASPTLSASPYIGAEPLLVNFSLVLPLATSQELGTGVVATWTFGDGSPAITSAEDANDDITLSTAKHLYQSAGDYAASVTLAGSGGSVTVPLTTPIGSAVHVQRMSPDTRGGAPTMQITGIGFVGSFAAPLSDANVIETTPTATGNIVYQESKRDSAGFDIDRFPDITQINRSDFRPTLEDTDFTGQLYVSYSGAFPATVFNQADWRVRAFDANQDPASDNTPGTHADYLLPAANAVPDRFRIITTLGGAVFGSSPSLVGDLMLQAGRVEP
jgi:subtilisin-like proprotein convertase family protein